MLGAASPAHAHAQAAFRRFQQLPEFFHTIRMGAEIRLAAREIGREVQQARQAADGCPYVELRDVRIAAHYLIGQRGQEPRQFRVCVKHYPGACRPQPRQTSREHNAIPYALLASD